MKFKYKTSSGSVSSLDRLRSRDTDKKGHYLPVLLWGLDYGRRVSTKINQIQTYTHTHTHTNTHTHTHTHTNFLALNVIIILCIPAGSVVCTTSSKHLKNQSCILVHLYKHMVTFGAIAATSPFVSNSFCEPSAKLGNLVAI